MGVLHLYKLIAKHAPGAIKRVPVTALRGWTVGIDASIAIYQWWNGGRRAGAPPRIVNAAGIPINHVQGAFYRSAALLTVGIKPVYVFDGPPPVAKGAALAQRRRRRADTSTPPPAAFEDVQQVLQHMRVQCIVAPGEADAQLGYMAAWGIIDAVASTDMDLLAFGARYLIRGLGATTTAAVEVIDRDAVLSALGLTLGAFVDLCILLGTEYTGPSGVGPETALRLMRQYGSIEQAVGAGALKLSRGFNYAQARAVFSASPVADVDVTGARPSDDDLRALRALLIDTYGLLGRRIDGTLRALSGTKEVAATVAHPRHGTPASSST